MTDYIISGLIGGTIGVLIVAVAVMAAKVYGRQDT
jgi:hypothetical protein